MRACLCVLLLSCLLAGCAVKAPRQTRQAEDGFTQRIIENNGKPIVTRTRDGMRGGNVTVYIEGDGKAFSANGKPSSDPTPRTPVALELALLDRAANVMHVGRPCQWATGKGCSKETWTAQRWNEATCIAMLNAIKSHVGGRPVRLIGYSGGAYIAAWVAAHMDNVMELVTVAGNLDPESLMREHSIQAPEQAMPATKLARLLAATPQVHVIGDQDDVVSDSTSRIYAYVGRDVRTVTAPATHADGWSAFWVKTGAATMLP